MSGKSHWVTNSVDFNDIKHLSIYNITKTQKKKKFFTPSLILMLATKKMNNHVQNIMSLIINKPSSHLNVYFNTNKATNK